MGEVAERVKREVRRAWVVVRELFLCLVNPTRLENAFLREELRRYRISYVHQDALVEALEQLRRSEESRIYAQSQATRVLKVLRALGQERGGIETVATVTEWADETFGKATIRAQIERAKKEFIELLQLQEIDHDNVQLAEEAADVCICLYRVIGTLDPEAINKKMAKNRARKWMVDGQGCAQHVVE